MLTRAMPRSAWPSVLRTSHAEPMGKNAPAPAPLRARPSTAGTTQPVEASVDSHSSVQPAPSTTTAARSSRLLVQRRASGTATNRPIVMPSAKAATTALAPAASRLGPLAQQLRRPRVEADLHAHAGHDDGEDHPDPARQRDPAAVLAVGGRRGGPQRRAVDPVLPVELEDPAHAAARVASASGSMSSSAGRQVSPSATLAPTAQRRDEPDAGPGAVGLADRGRRAAAVVAVEHRGGRRGEERPAGARPTPSRRG